MSDAGKPKDVIALGASPASGGEAGTPPPNGNHSSDSVTQLFSLIADNVPQSIWVTDAEGNVKFLNKHWYEYSGTSARSVTAAQVAAESVHPEDAPALMAAFQEAIRTGNGFEVEQRNRAADGEYRWFLNRANPYRDPDTGEIKFWFGVSIDIHDGKIGRDDEKFLLEISEMIRVADQAEELLGEISDRLGGYLHLHRCLFNEIDLNSDTETVHRDFARDGESVAGRHRISIYSPEASEAMATGKPIVNHDSEKDPRTAAYFHNTYGPAKEVAYIAVPMMRRGRWVASLWCSDDRPRQWSNRETSLVENIAERAWAAVERLRAEQDLRRQRDQLNALAETARLLAETEGLEEQLKVVTDKARSIVGAHQAATSITTSGDRAHSISAVSLSDKYAEYRSHSAESGGFGDYWTAFENRKPVRLTQEELEEHPAWRGLREEKGEHPPMRGCLAVPLVGEIGSTIGAIQLSDKFEGEFNAEDEAVIAQLAQLASSVIERTRAREAAARNQKTVNDLVEKAPFGIYVTDSDFRIAAMNSGSQKVTFANVHPVIGRDLGEAMRILWPDPVAAEILGHFRRTLETGQPYYSREFTHLRGDTATVESYEWELHRIILPDGRFGVVCYYYDSTKLRESQLREREQIRRALNATAKFETLFNQSGIFAGIVDLDGNLIEINDLAVDQCGFAREDVLDRPYWETGWWSGSHEVRAKVRTAVEASIKGESFRCVMAYWRADGTERVMDFGLHPIRNETGDVIFLNATGVDITDRKRAEDALRESEARFRNMADYAPVMVWVTDPSGYCTFLSRSWYQFTGQSEESALGFGWLEATHPDDRWSAEETFRSANDRCEPFSFEYRIRRADGEYRWAIDSARPRFSEDGVFLGFIGSVIDITERKTVEEGLKRSEEEFRTVTDAAPALVWVANEEGDLTYFNERWYEFTGLTPEGSIGSGWTSAVHPDDLAALLPRWQHSQITGESYEGHCRYRRADGEFRWHTFRALPRRTKNGDITGWYGLSVDIHEEKAVADRVRTSEERYRALTELSPQMVYMSRPDGSITYANQYTIEWTGKSLGELQSDFWAGLIHPDHRERIFNVWKTATAIGAEYEVDVPFRHVDGTYRTLYNRALPIKDENGEVRYWIGTALDVEDRKRAEENLRESEQRFRQASDSAPVLIWMSDATKRGIWFNKPWLDFTGRSMEEETGDGWFSRIHPDDQERCHNIHAMSFANKQEFAMEYRLQRADGEYRWMLDRGVPRVTPDGTFLGFIGSCIDIHDRRAAEAALRRSEARLQLATRLGGYGTWDLNLREGRHIWSDRLFETFGLTPSPNRLITDDLYHKYIVPEDLERLKKLNEATFNSREPFTAEYRIRRADNGELRWLDVAAQHFFDTDGKPVRTIGITQDITERKLASEAIRASEERLKLAQQAGNVGVWDWDVTSNTTFWSEQMWAFFGDAPQDSGLRHELWLERLHPDDRERMHEAVQAALGSDVNELKEEFRIIRNDGEQRWLEVIATVERDNSGSAARMYGVNLDVTERKAIAERIRSSEAQLRLVTDSIPALVSYIDKDERYRFINQRYTEWFGLDQDQIIGHTMAEVLGLDAREQLKSRIGEVLAGSTTTFEVWVDYGVAGRKFVHISYVPDRHDSGEVLGFYALVTDLTAQKLSEERLRSTEDRMRIISESFTDYAIISMDAEGRIESWNAGAENIFGFAADEIVGKPADVLFTPEDVARGVPAEELGQAERLGRASDERWHMRKDGTRFFASGVSAPLYVGDKLTGFAKIATDLTEKKRNAEALQRAYDEMENRVLERTRELASMNETLMREISERQTAERQKIELLKRLVSGQEEERRRIARDLHDHLGQRLTALRLKLASLREACAGDEELFTRATRLQEIAELIDSEVSFLAWELRPSTLDELGLIDAMGAFVKEWSRHYDINAEFHSSGLGDVRLDREAETHLYRITQEALNNIFKHANAKNVSVLVERAGKEVVLIIEDDGKGFGKADTEKLRKSNRGLGLTGMRERADLIGGTLEIESEIGKGATIYVRIPVEADKGLNDER